MPERCASRCSTVTSSATSGRSSPSSDRAGVSSAKRPSSIRLTTASAVIPLTPLAMPNRVSAAFAISQRRSASPYARSRTSSPPRSTRTTPENRDSAASASTSGVMVGYGGSADGIRQILGFASWFPRPSSRRPSTGSSRPATAGSWSTHATRAGTTSTAGARSATSRATRTSPRSGVNVQVLLPGEPMAMYHWEVDQEDFLVVSGEALLIVEGEERTAPRLGLLPLREPDEAHHRRRGRRSVRRRRGRRAREPGRSRLGRLYGRRGRARHGAGVEQDTSDPERGVRRSSSKRGSRRATATAGCPRTACRSYPVDANMCSYAGSDDPPRRPRRVLRIGRAAGRQDAPREAGARRRRRRAGGELRGEGVRRSGRRWAGGRRGGSARTRSSSRPGCRRTRRRARPSSRCSRTRPRSSRGSRSTRRSSTSAASSGSRERPSRSRRGSGGGCSTRSDCRSPSVSRERSSSRRSQARSRSPTAFCVVPPDDELGFLHPLPVERLWGVGQGHRGEAARPRPPDGRAGRRPRRVAARAPPRPGIRPPPARARAQPRPAARAGRAPAALDRVAAGARPASDVLRGDRLVDRRNRRPGRAAAASRSETLPDRRSAAPLRRLHPCDEVADDASTRPISHTRSWTQLAPSWRPRRRSSGHAGSPSSASP